MTVHPDISTWNLYPDADDPEAVIKEKEALIRSLDFTGYTLGPVGVTPGSFAHWNQVRADLNKAIELGWVPDATLASNLLSQLAAARKALNAGDGTAAKAKLHTLIETVMGASDAQRRPEVRDLLGLNAEALIRVTPNTPVPFELETDFTPRKTQVPVGTEHTVTATAVNVALDNAPVPGHPFDLQISAGPHAGQSFYGYTDAQGRFRFGYTGVRLGTDLIVSYAGSMETDSLQVTWVGGADLAVPLFVPPLLKSEGGKTVFITDITRNLGTIGAPASTTRYYLSESPPPFDTASATLVGERAVPPLGAREDSNVDQVPFVVPAGLAKGTYYLAACADARAEVIELDETNNCSFSEIQGVTSVVVAAEPPQNHPPDCTLAHADPATLWPPNHRLVNVAIEGVSDPDHDPVSLTVTAITQDEPVNGLGDGDAGPDGFGVGQVSVRLRSERSGTGNGRVYAIVVAADDGRDGRCDATVRVGVPHDYGEGANPVDDGQQYDSTML